MPPTTTGMSLAAGLAQRVHDRGDQLAVGARQDREADHVHALVDGRAGDLLAGQPDALVDDLHADVAGADGDLLGAVGVPVEAGLADQDLHRAAERLGRAGDLVAQLGHVLGRRRGAAASPMPVGRAVGAEDVAQRLRPLAGGGAGAGARRASPPSTFSSVSETRRSSSSAASTAAWSRAARHCSSASLGVRLDAGVDGQDAAVLARGQRRRPPSRCTC